MDKAACEAFLKKHYQEHEKIEALYRNRDKKSGAILEVIRRCETVAADTEKFLECWKVCHGDNRPGHNPAIQQLAIIRERQRLYSEAVGLLEFADSHGFGEKDGQSYQARIDRLLEKRHKQGEDETPEEEADIKTLDGSRWKDPKKHIRTSGIKPSEIFALVFAAAVALFFLGQCAMGNLGDQRTAEERQLDREVERERRYCSDSGTALHRAYQRMQEPVAQQHLVSPSTAEFQPVYEAQGRYLDQCRHEFFFWVDAQNQVGGTVRTHLRVETEYLAGEHRWELMSVTEQ